MSPQAPGQEGRGRGGEGCGGRPQAPDSRPPQPHLDVQERIRDVQPGVQVRDIIRTRCLKAQTYLMVNLKVIKDRMLLYNPKLNGLVHSLDYINFIRVQATHLAVTEDGSLVRSHARVLDLRHEALELRPGLLVLGEAGQRPFHPSAWR